MCHAWNAAHAGPEDVSESQHMDTELEKQPGRGETLEGGDQERDSDQQDGVVGRAEEQKPDCQPPGGGSEPPLDAVEDRTPHTMDTDAHTGESVMRK
jgi:hypothetical protein